MKIKEIIVVEGRDDTTAIQRAVDADTIETNGSAIGESVLKRIALAKERRGVIILTDPDYPGERIRKIVSKSIPGCKHAFLPKEDAISKKGDDLGVENATPEAIRLALQSVHKENQDQGETAPLIVWEDLHAAGLIAGKNARRSRERLGEELSIGYANGKQLLKRLHMFQIDIEEFRKALMTVSKEEQQDD